MNNHDYRHHYPKNDASETAKLHKKYRKRYMLGSSIEPDFLKYRRLIDDYIYRKYGFTRNKKSMVLNESDFDLILFMASFNRSFSRSDFHNKSSFGHSRFQDTTQMKRLIDNGFLKVFEGCASRKNREQQFKLTKKAREMVREYYSYCYQTRTMSFSSNNIDGEFLKDHRYPMRKFNEEVEINIKQK